MLSKAEKLVQLQQLLAEPSKSPLALARVVTGVPLLDEIGVPSGAITELVGAKGPAATLLLYGLLHALAQKGERVALIDGKDSFSPRDLTSPDLAQVLWLRCPDAAKAVQAADLMVRDGNLPFVLVLLLLNPVRELRRIPPTAWHRLQRLAETSGTALLVFTPQALIPGTALRLALQGPTKESAPLTRDGFSIQAQIERKRRHG